ncbi:MAG: hypothetical protein GF405_00970 [Candidatus Eisenbacteria bacterium]|nr:hypothetical protein [Candidatus Eisenbacteria bacterium]
MFAAHRRRSPERDPGLRRGAAGPAGGASRTVLIILVAALCLGGVLRWAYINEHRRSPEFTEPFSDAEYHDYWARGLAFGSWTRPPNEPDPEIHDSPYLRPPGYPFFLALIFRATGGGYLAPRVVQAALGLLSAWLAFVLCRRWFGTVAGLTAAFLMAVNWSFIYFEGEFQAPALLIPLLLFFALLMSDQVRGVSARKAFVAGLVLGAAVITRPNALLLVPAAGLWMFRLGRRGARRGLGAAFLALVAGTVLVMAPVTIRNAVASGEFVPVTSNTGVNLLMGNNPEANGLCDGDLPGIGEFGTCFDYPAVVDALEEQVGRPLTHAEASNLMTRRALRFVLENPGEALRLTGIKALLFWGPFEVSHNTVVELERKDSSVLSAIPVGFPFLAALGLLGCGIVLAELRSRHRRSGGTQGEDAAEDASIRTDEGLEVAVLIALLLAAWFVSILPFFAASRYRVPAVPFLVLLGAAGVEWIVGRVRSRAWRAISLWGAVFAGLLVLASIRFVPYRADRGIWHYNRAMSHAATGELATAVREYRAAIEEKPSLWQAHIDLGVALARRGEFAEAGRHMMDALRLNPTDPHIHYNVALLMEATGQLERSEEHLLEVLRLAPGFPGARRDLSRVRSAIEGGGRTGTGSERDTP